MRRSGVVILLACAALFGAADCARAVPFTSSLTAQGNDAINGLFTPDMIVMSIVGPSSVTFATAPPPSSFSAGGTWSYSVSGPGTTAVLTRTSPLTGQSAPLTWLQNFDGPSGDYSFDVDWSLFQRDGLGGFSGISPGGGTTVAVAIPEPSTFLILGLGGLAAAARMRRRRAAATTSS